MVVKRAKLDLIWLDGFAGLVSGLAVLGLANLIQEVHSWPRWLIQFHGLVSLGYAAFALFLASRLRRPLQAIQFLALANLTWAAVCVVLALRLGSTMTRFGIGHLILESLGVGILGIVEWRRRQGLQLSDVQPKPSIE